MKSTMSKISTKIKRIQQAKGQSLVEMAIITPLLIFMLIGLFEVGWALRGYLTLVNANREITRFSVRPGYLNYSEEVLDMTKAPPAGDYGVGYDRVRDYLFTALADQLGVKDFEQNNAMIVSHIVADTGWPCERDVVLGNKPGKVCNCNAFDEDHADFNPNYDEEYTVDDLILYPGKPGFDLTATYIYTFPVTTTYQSRLDFAAEAEKLARENNRFNCELLEKTGGTTLPSANNLITTELFFNQPQLFGFPLISNPFTDPVPMYTHTTMRVPGCPRNSDNCNSVGDVCLVSPMIVYENDWQTWVEGQTYDILGGPNSSDFGWLGWDPQETSADYLRSELQIGRASINTYTNPDDKDDHKLDVGDWVRSMQGAKPVHDAVGNYIVNREIIIPVYDDFQKIANDLPPPAMVDAYQIKRFIKVRATGNFDVSSSNKYIMATYLGEADNICQ